MPKDIDARIERLLDQLEDPNLLESQIEKIKMKLKLLQDLQSQQA